MQKAIEFFREAINKDPNYALAYVGLSDSYGAMGGWLWCEPKVCYPLAKAAALKAISIDSELAQAHATLAALLYILDWKWKDADDEFRKALELNPGYSMAYRAYGAYLIALGRFEEAKVKLQRAWEIEPGSIMNYSTYWDLYYCSGDYDQAIAIMQKMRESYPDRADVYRRLADAYERKGMYDQSFAERLEWHARMGSKPQFVEELKNAYAASGIRGYWQKNYGLLEGNFSPQQDAKKERRHWAMFNRASAYARIGNKEGALYWLQQAYIVRARGLVTIKVEPVFDGVRNDPRFVRIVSDIELEP